MMQQRVDGFLIAMNLAEYAIGKACFLQLLRDNQ
jgi:hypothetical protein